MAKIIYLAHYNASLQGREASPAGTTVMSYVIECLDSLGKKTVVVSPARSKNALPREEIEVSSNIKLVFMESFKKSNKNNYFKRYFRHKKLERALMKELLKQVEDGDTLLVYHSLSLMKFVKKIKKKRNITLVLQVCEIYADVLENKKIRKKEFSCFLLADKYIFQTEVLNQIVNTKSLPYTVLHGTYRSVPERVKENVKFDSSKIQCVYAGTLDTRKGGALTAANIASFLPENFHVHILGFGSKSEVSQIKEAVKRISLTSKASISYDGCLQGEEYLDFIANCHVGLSTQSPVAAFNVTSFPSKILAYMASGLRVVTVRIPAVETSCVGKYLYYYDFNDPESIAKTIQQIDFSDDYNGKQKIDSLNKQFLQNLDILL